MLDQLHIANFALIVEMTIDFAPGLTVLTGETGAGKSILVGALGLLRGGKGDGGVVRSGATEAMVAGTFRVSDLAVAWLSERGISVDDGRVLVRRTIKNSGKGAIFVQSMPVTRADLAGFAGLLFDIHGQHDHQALFVPETHRQVLDDFGRYAALVDRVGVGYRRLTALRKELEALEGDQRALERERDMLEFAIKEIEEARLQPDEDADLEQERTRLTQHEKLAKHVENSFGSLSESHGGAVALLRAVRHDIAAAATIDPTLTDLAARVDDAFFEVEDIAESLLSYQDRVVFDPDRIEAIEERLNRLFRLKRKYGDTIADVLDYAETARRRMSLIETGDSRKAQLARDCAQADAALATAAQELSKARTAVAQGLSDRIEATLHHLGMARARFAVTVEQKTSDRGRPVCGVYGIDDVRFLIAANIGEPLKPLQEIASGGEISRVMLAIKTVLAQTDSVETMVFDEIDSGIGGEVAVSVGEHLAMLGRHKQVLCITHLATIAARADNHLVVRKIEVDDRTATTVDVVTNERRVEEIARMLAGDREGAASRSHALELLQRRLAEGAR